MLHHIDMLALLRNYLTFFVDKDHWKTCTATDKCEKTGPQFHKKQDVGYGRSPFIFVWQMINTDMGLKYEFYDLIREKWEMPRVRCEVDYASASTT